MELSHKLAKVRPNSSVERVALSGGQGSPERSAGEGPGFDPRLGLFFLYVYLSNQMFLYKIVHALSQTSRADK